MLSLNFQTIQDPDGWHPHLRLKGDWLVFEISDGVHTGYGEASHSRHDARCKQIAGELFTSHFSDFRLTLENIRLKEIELAAQEPDFVVATAYSGLNQALYDLLAKRHQVPVWQLFSETISVESVPLYTTINRTLKTRSIEEYLTVVMQLVEQGFRHFKCAPFEEVSRSDHALARANAGVETLRRIRDRFPRIGIRVDFHERFEPDTFFNLVSEFEQLELEWIEEPFEMGPAYTKLKRLTKLPVAAGELFWGKQRFVQIMNNEWADVIMPDVKHVGGFGPLLDVIELASDKCQVSPHNPSGPISTAASLHAAVLFPDRVPCIEIAFDATGSRKLTGEQIDEGQLRLNRTAGWGICLP